MKTFIKGARVIDAKLDLDEVLDILINDEGAIEKIGANLNAELELDGDLQVIEADGLIAFPGLVDIHVHFRDPGQEYKENMHSGMRAAVHGGFTDVCTMPNTNPTCDTASVVSYQTSRAQELDICHVHPIGALTVGLKGEALAEHYSMAKAGAIAFSDDGHGVQKAGMLRTAMDYLTAIDGLVMSHCEDESLSNGGVVNEGVASTRLGVKGWQALAEELQVVRDIELSRLTGCRLHICHITSRAGVEAVRRAKEMGISVTCEVTPHHLFLNEDDITETYDTNFKMNPPLRTKADMEFLQEALIDGTIDCVATDHAPHADHEKALEFENAPFGLVGLETALPLVYTNLVASGKMSLKRLCEVMAQAPRDIVKLDQVTFEVGAKANITLFDPSATRAVDPEAFYSKAKNQPFTGMQLSGWPVHVFTDGVQTLCDGVVCEASHR